VWEALGEALMTVGETSEADRALRSASRLYGAAPIAAARICFRRGQIAEAGELSRAVRWMQRGLRVLEGDPEQQAHGWRARLVAELGWIRQRQRRYRDAERLCREALTAGEAAGELRAQARAAYTLDWALFELGRHDEATHSARALEIYRQLGDPEQEGRVLNNLGGLAYWRGRWQDAIDLYRQAGAAASAPATPRTSRSPTPTSARYSPTRATSTTRHATSDVHIESGAPRGTARGRRSRT